MKIAFLIYGEYREFDNVVPSWKFLSNLDCDFYFSTWSNSKQINNKLNIVKEFSVNEEMIRKYYPNAIIKISNLNDYSEIKDCWGNASKIYFHWKCLLELLKESEKKYDCVWLMRPDIYLKLDKNYDSMPTEYFSYLYENNIISVGYEYKKELNNTFFANDTLLIGRCDSIISILEASKNFEGEIHYSLGKFIYDSKIKVEMPKFFQAKLVRPNCFIQDSTYVLQNIEDVDMTYFDYKRIEWDDTLINKPFSDEIIK